MPGPIAEHQSTRMVDNSNLTRWSGDDACLDMARGQLIEATKPVTSMPGYGEEHKLDGLDALTLYYGSVRLSAALPSPQHARL